MAAIALAGCGKSKAASCKTEARELGAYLHAMDHTPTLIKIPDDIHLVIRPELASMTGFPDSPVVFVRATGIEFRGEHPSVDELAEKLAELAVKTQEDLETGKTPPTFKWDHSIYIAIDGDTPWSSVVAVASAAERTEYSKWTALFAKPSPVAAPPHSAITDELNHMIADDNRANAATEVAGLVSRIVKSCPALVKSFGAVASNEGDKAALLIEAIEPALIDCNCDLDMASLRSAFFAIAGNLHPIGTIAITLDNSASPISFPGATKWRDIAPKLSAGAAWFVAE